MTETSTLDSGLSPQPDIADPAFIGKTNDSQPICLNIGAGIPDENGHPAPLPGFTPIDSRLGHDALHLPYEDETVQAIYASHVLEHISHTKREQVLAEWYRVLKPGGSIMISVPDMKKVAAMYLEGRYDLPLEGIWYGDQQYEGNEHRAGYDEESLSFHLDKAGFVGISRFAPFHPDCSQLEWSLNIEAIKPPFGNTKMRRKITACMSAPRLLFLDQVNSVENVLRPLGIPVSIHTGSNWGQCLERCFTDAVNQGYEWIVALDYDTVFSESQFVRMMALFEAYGDKWDALAPLQIKREGNAALFWRGDRGRIPVEEIARPIFAADSAHFGCTFIKTEILKKMPHPWFHHVPNAAGEWQDGRVDDDINFWASFRKAGGRLGVTSRLCVGHLQLMVSWLGEGYQPVHQFVTDYRKYGPPLGTGHSQAGGLVGARGAG